MKVRILYTVMVTIFTVTFAVGVFMNPNFNIYDFCMNLASEILGLAIALVIVETYIKEKAKRDDSQKDLNCDEKL
ncbi:hypothetical protein M2454_002596 [Aequitasia blattaphilus]|uniref:Uncharacterized protein n=1 Tax=Aequitasia blattaphilus TaxID=2949332 RepID=A0ABT1EBI2_9FIRM|nr:hypothetical protein [Aequitasia blattaphilus]MCP1103193.1 hypothetical protein [Aequitasia blattaphilus]MCR8615833.1 hypothetical protein [Aequitasia blattaphilus]